MATRKAQGGKRPAMQVTAANAGTKPAAGDLSAEVGRFPVLSPLRFDGRLYQPDDPDANVVEMTPDQAAPLLPIGVLGERLA